MIRTRGERLFDYCNYAILGIVGFLCLYPFIYLFALALNEGTDTYRGGITFYPREFTLVNFMAILTDRLIMNAYKITILKTMLGTVTSVFVTAIVAYGLAEKKLPGRWALMLYMLVPMLFSGGLIPYFLNLRVLGLINTFWVYILPPMFVIWNCIVMKAFFQQIPEEMRESARVDGAHELTILFRIVFPLSLPLFAAISLFVAVTQWNDWFVGAFFVKDLELVPVQTYLQSLLTRELADFVGQDLQRKMSIEFSGGRDLNDYASITSLSLKIAAVIVGTLPILVVYPFLQKYFVKGVLLGSVKG